MFKRSETSLFCVVARRSRIASDSSLLAEWQDALGCEISDSFGLFSGVIDLDAER